MQDIYKILGVSKDASMEEIEASYKALKEKYSSERFLEGEAGNEAAKNLTLLENAYREIKSEKIAEQTNAYSEIEKDIKGGNIDLAQEKLDSFSSRDAEWHYLQSVVFYKKNWINESKKQLEIAMSMEPENKKYSNAYTKLKEKIAFNERQFQSGTAHSSQTDPRANATQQQMGGSGVGDCCSWCATWCCMNAVFNLCLNACCGC